MSEAPARDDSSAGDLGIWWYALALVVFIVAGFVTQRTVLNWIVGPLFPLLILYIVPTVARRVIARVRAAQ